MNMPLAEIHDLGWRYAVGPQVLTDINLVIKQGECLGVVGKSGSGKSTLAMALCGLIPQSYAGAMRGSVVVAGCDTATTPLSHLASHVSMVFQTPEDQLSQMFVLHEVASGPANLMLPKRDVLDRAYQSLELVGIEQLANRQISTLSGGQKQKVVIAGTLAMQPKLLIMDEPTTDLDPKAKQEVMETIRHIKETTQTTIVIVSHELETIISLVDRLLVVENGQIVIDGPTQEVITQLYSLNLDGIHIPELVQFNLQMRSVFPNWPVIAAADRVVKRLKTNGIKPSSNHVYRPSKDTVVKLENVSYSYPLSNSKAVNDVSLTVQNGEIAAIVGHNGSGKTTLSKLISGILQPSEGNVCLFGKKVVTINPNLIGYIFQNPDAMLSQVTVQDEVEFSPKVMNVFGWKELALHALERFELTSLSSRFPLALSKGQRQRLAYASVIAADPPILIFDEPTTGIDKVGCDAIMHYMDKLRCEGKTILFITHDISLALGWADRIVIMHEGKIVHDGAPETLLSIPGDVLNNLHIKLPGIWELGHKLGLKDRQINLSALLTMIKEKEVCVL